MAWPSHARSVVDSPNPAAEYRYAARQRADWFAQSAWRYSDLPIVTLLAERFASTVAPASAAYVLGGTGTQTSSQTSTKRAKPGTFSASKIRSLPRSEEHTSELQSREKL